MANIEEIIKSRHSVRHFTDQRIEGATLNSLKQTIDECNKESGLNIQLALNETKAFGEGHYGNFVNCKNYIALIGNKSDDKLNQKCGYYGEKIVLKAQELGLNSCWVAMTYKKKEVPFKIRQNEKMVIVIAIGYGVNGGVSHKIKEFEQVSKTARSDAPAWYIKGIEYALLAPTAINQQKFIFELARESEVSLESKIGPCSKIDLGIVKYHFELGAGKEKFKWSEQTIDLKKKKKMKKKTKMLVIIIIFVLFMITFAYLFHVNKILEKRIEYLEKRDVILSDRITENAANISNLQTQKENVNNESEKLAESVFDCSPTDGLSPISEEEAKKVWEEFKKEYNIDEYGIYYTQEIQVKDVIPNTYLYYNYYQGKVEGRQATFTRKAYVFICNMNNENLDWVDGYVDMYTGKVIGGQFYGV
ncbi:MAG: nitroreductase family protein [Clostridia bacterium]